MQSVENKKFRTQIINQNGANIGITQTVTIDKIPANKLSTDQSYYVYVRGEWNSKKVSGQLFFDDYYLNMRGQ